ncbi:MAG TPA: AMP phosphorylase [Candidatus Limnocylindrales bacterium]|nr:AMP phosphorylase [Candidatus Limnocylindrales bacterium]
MELTVEVLPIMTGGSRIAILSEESASVLGVHSSDRIRIKYANKEMIAIANIAAIYPHKRIGLYEETATALGVKEDETVSVQLAPLPESLFNVRAKLRGERLPEKDIVTIVKDVVERHLSSAEIAAFLTALSIHGLSASENEALSRAMVATGKTLSFGEGPVLDKHSVGGIPGDKTSMLVVPIIAAAGFTIPKTSSRAITSPAGTADRVEALCPVNLTIDEIKDVVAKTNGCLVWGGALELAPADDLFIQVEYPLGIDPMLLPSILSKKKAMGATHVAIDIPTGMAGKIKTRTEAYTLASDFVDLGKRLGLNIQCALTFGDQPLGCGIGPALEAREALTTLLGGGPPDLRDKAVSLAGMLLEMVGVESGRAKAEDVLDSGKAEVKMREIIAAQGGNPKIQPDDVPVGPERSEVRSEGTGKVIWLSTEDIVRIAREAGAPKEKGAGMILHAKLGETVHKGAVLFEIYAERTSKLASALELANRLSPVLLTRKPAEKMILDQVPEKLTHEKAFMLDR